jgi:hypothetical protein
MLPGETTDIFADRDLSLVARYSGHGRARVVVEGRRGTTPVTWTSTVDFPDRDRENSFVARLWATQRVGYLSAQKRNNGGSSEIDDEIRSLGERYGIPTEFTSYLVTERQDLPVRTAMMGAGGGPVAAARRPQAVGEGCGEPGVRVREVSVGATNACPTWPRSTLSLANGRPMRTKDEARHPARRRTDVHAARWRVDRPVIVRYAGDDDQAVLEGVLRLVATGARLKPVFALGDRVVVVGKTRRSGWTTVGRRTGPRALRPRYVSGEL